MGSESKYVSAVEAISWIAFRDFSSLGRFLLQQRRNIVRQVNRAQGRLMNAILSGDLELFGNRTSGFQVDGKPFVVNSDLYCIVPLLFLNELNNVHGLYAGIDLLSNRFNAPTEWHSLWLLRSAIIAGAKDCGLDSNAAEALPSTPLKRPASKPTVHDWFVAQRLPLYGSARRKPTRDEDWEACRANFGVNAAHWVTLKEVRNAVLASHSIEPDVGRPSKSGKKKMQY